MNGSEPMVPNIAAPGTCFFEDRLSPGQRALLFCDPLGVIEAWHLADVPAALAAAGRAQARGQYLAGYIAYEAGHALEPRLAAQSAPPQGIRKETGAAKSPAGERALQVLPLLRFHVYSQMIELDGRAADQLVARDSARGHAIEDPTPGQDARAHAAKVERILAYIRAGDIYQANYTFPLQGCFKGSALSLYAALRTAQPVRFGAFIAGADADICSLSPELFVRRAGNRLETRPMKGTAPRGNTPADDAARQRRLRGDAKERAENLMIVDLLRNDLSRVCAPGTVKVRQLFDVETYPTLHTMTSTIEGQVAPRQEAADILAALFPCGSITGAPKIRAQEIIHELEQPPRGVYTGTIGYMLPGGDFSFSVAIRTLTASKDGTYTYPVGGGIVADSDPAREYAECLLKARLLTDETKPFDLIETILWTPEDGFALLARHMERLARSAAYFHRPYRRGEVLGALDAAVASGGAARLRVRLLLKPDGEVQVTATPLPGEGSHGPVRFVFADETVDAADPYLRHKTTRRDHFERQLTLARDLGAAEAIFENQYGEITEGAWTNVFVERAGRLLTPPLSAGLLRGTLRAELLAQGRAEEVSLTRADVLSAEAVYLGNSVRGLMRAERATGAAGQGQAELASNRA